MGPVVLGGSTPPPVPVDGLKDQLKAACEVEPGQDSLRLDDGPCGLGEAPTCAQLSFQNVSEGLALGEPEPRDQQLLGAVHEPPDRQRLVRAAPLPPEDSEL